MKNLKARAKAYYIHMAIPVGKSESKEGLTKTNTLFCWKL